MGICIHGEVSHLCKRCPDLSAIATSSSNSLPSRASASTASSSLSSSSSSSAPSSFAVNLPSGLRIRFFPYGDPGKNTHHALLEYERPISVPSSTYCDVRPFQQALSVPGFGDKAPVFRANVAQKVAELNANPFLIPEVPVIYKDGYLWLQGDKHHTFVAALLAQRAVHLVKARLSQFASTELDWRNIVWVEGSARDSSAITPKQITT